MERLKRFLAVLTRWGLSLCALLLVLAAVYVSLGRELTPLVAEYRAEVEAKAQPRSVCPCRSAVSKGVERFRAICWPRCDGVRAAVPALDQVEVVHLWAPDGPECVLLTLSQRIATQRQGRQGGIGPARIAVQTNAAGSGAVAQAHADGQRGRCASINFTVCQPR